jgi:predicted amidohydrolase
MAIRIGICQLASYWGAEDRDPRPANLNRALEAISAAADRGARLLAFGVADLTGYEARHLTQRFAVAPSVDDPFVAPLVECAAERDLVIVMGATTQNDRGDVRNSALVIGPSGLIGVYSKTHVAAFVFDGDRTACERAYWSPGDALKVFDTPVGRLGVEICYDVWFPEVARTLALEGAELIVNLSAVPRGFETGWDHLLWVRSAENAIPYLHVSVVGPQRGTEFVGGCRLFGPSGEVLAQAPSGREDVLVTTLDTQLTAAARGLRHPFSARNPRLYEPIARLPDAGRCPGSRAPVDPRAVET